MKKQVAFAFVAMLAPVPTLAQSVVYTNIVNGQRTVRVVRETKPVMPVPSSIRTSEVLPKNWRPPIGASSYVPPAPPPAATKSRSYRRRPPTQPMFVNGIYIGPSPTGNWTSTTIGRPTVDVRIVSSPQRHTTSSSRQEKQR